MRGETQHEFLAMANAIEVRKHQQREPNLSFPRKGAQPGGISCLRKKSEEERLAVETLATLPMRSKKYSQTCCRSNLI